MTTHPITLTNIFANTNDNHQRATALLDFCNTMLENGVGFPDLRKNFSSSEFNKTMTQWSAFANTLTDKDGHAFMPNPSRTDIIIDKTDSLALHEWGKLFIDVNMSALDKKIEKYREPEIIKQPNMVYAAFKKLWSGLNLNI